MYLLQETHPLCSTRLRLVIFNAALVFSVYKCGGEASCTSFHWCTYCFRGFERSPPLHRVPLMHATRIHHTFMCAVELATFCTDHEVCPLFEGHACAYSLCTRTMSRSSRHHALGCPSCRGIWPSATISHQDLAYSTCLVFSCAQRHIGVTRYRIRRCGVMPFDTVLWQQSSYCSSSTVGTPACCCKRTAHPICHGPA